MLAVESLGWLYKTIFYSSVITGIQAIFRTQAALLVLGLKPDTTTSVFVFCTSVFLYSRDRLKNSAPMSQCFSAPEPRAIWLADNQGRLRILTVTAGLGSLMLAIWHAKTIPVLLGIFGAGALYTVRWLPGQQSFKSLPGMKTPFVALVWAILVVLLPLAVQNHPITHRAELVATIIFLFMCAIVSLNDIYDMDDDRATGTRSIAVMLGERNTRIVAAAFSLSGSAVALFALGGPGSLGLALAGLYHATYCASVRSDWGRDNPLSVLIYRSSSIVMTLLVALTVP